MIINHNITALNTHNKLSAASAAQSKSMEKLASGLRINKAGDDAAGLAISEKMRAQVRGLDQASRNAQDGISLIQTAEGALNETHDILQRMREVTNQSANGTNNDDDRKALQKEMNQLTSEITRIGNNTEFNTKKLMNGELNGTGAVQQRTTINFDTLLSTEDSTDSVKFSVDGEEYTITGLNSAAPGTIPAVDNTNKTVSIGTSTSAGGSIDDVVAGLQQLQAQDPSSKLAQFDISRSGTGLAITAKASGAYAGAKSNNNTVLITDKGTTAATKADVTGQDAKDGLKFQVGANQDQRFSITVSDMRSGALKLSGAENDALGTGVTGAVFTNGSENTLSDKSGADAEYALDILSSDTATAALTVIDSAIKDVSSERAKLGSYQNRLDHTINNLKTSSENLTAAESRVRDVDMAKEMMNQTKNSILAQAAQAMLAQSNQTPQGVLQLLR